MEVMHVVSDATVESAEGATEGATDGARDTAVDPAVDDRAVDTAPDDGTEAELLPWLTPNLLSTVSAILSTQVTWYDARA